MKWDFNKKRRLNKEAVLISGGPKAGLHCTCTYYLLFVTR